MVLSIYALDLELIPVSRQSAIPGHTSHKAGCFPSWLEFQKKWEGQMTGSHMPRGHMPVYCIDYFLPLRHFKRFHCTAVHAVVGLGFCIDSWRDSAGNKLGWSRAESLEACHPRCELLVVFNCFSVMISLCAKKVIADIPLLSARLNTRATTSHSHWCTVRVKKNPPPLRTCHNFSQIVGYFSTKFYTPIIRSYLRKSTNFYSINCNFDEVMPY